MEKQIKDVIRESRKKCGLTQEQLAEKLNVSNKTVSKWETGKSYPDILLLSAISKHLNIPVTEFFNCDEAKAESINENSISKILNCRRLIVLAILILLFSPLPVLLGYLFQRFTIMIVMISLSTIMVLTSIVIAVLENIKVKDFCITETNGGFIRKFRNATDVYFLLWYFMLSILSVSITSKLVFIITTSIIYIVFSAFPILSGAVLGFNVLNAKKLIHFVGLLISVSIYIFLWSAFNKTAVYIISYIALLISQIINYVLMINQRK